MLFSHGPKRHLKAHGPKMIDFVIAWVSFGVSFGAAASFGNFKDAVPQLVYMRLTPTAITTYCQHTPQRLSCNSQLKQLDYKLP